MKVNDKRWQILNQSQVKNLKEIVDILLKNRNLTRLKDKNDFLKSKNPSKYSLKELKISTSQLGKSIKRLKKAREDNEKIIIFGDYDADGITATAILWECLYGLGFNCLPFIPSRFEDGYGINPDSLKRIIDQNQDLKLIITVDNGIVADKAVDFANKNNIQVIITDHHKKNKKTPKAYSIIHTTKTSGSAVSWLFSREIEKSFSEKTNLVDKSVELAAIGTVADQLPLVGFNRSIVKFGLEKLRTTKRIGLKSLFRVSSIDQDKIGTYDINYSIAPRINASGRIASGMDGLRLLCTKNNSRSRELASSLDRLNKERQDMVLDLYDVAEKELNSEKIIIVHSEQFHEGVIGLIASRLVEKYYRPTIVISLESDLGKASARSIKGFSIVDAINQFRGLIIEGGGHDMAAGFSIKKKKIAKFKKDINAYFENTLSGDIMSPSLEIETHLDLKSLNFSLLNKLEKFEPFGIGNKRPVFYTKECKIKGMKRLGSEKNHLKFYVTSEGVDLEGIYFQHGFMEEELAKMDKVDIAYQLDRNVWNGNEKLQLIIKDVRRSNIKPI